MTVYCGARTKSCRNCGHRYTKEEYDLWECPECGEDRHCRRAVNEEGDRCRFHGGRSPRGIASPSFVHGRLSKYLPDRLAPRYAEAEQDEDLLALRGEISVLYARMTELLEQVGTGESGPAWGQLRDLNEEMVESLENGDLPLLERQLNEMRELEEIGVSQRATWSEIQDVIEQSRLLKQTEHKRLSAMHQMISVEQAMTMIARVTRAVIDNVSDPDERLAIVSDLRNLTLR